MLFKLHLDAQGRYSRFNQARPELMNRVPLKYIASYLDVTQSPLSRVSRKIMEGT